MLTPRLSLSRSPSPVSPVAKELPEPLGSVPGVPRVIQRSMDLLDVAMAHYLPGNIDPDDSSVKKLCKDEDIELDHVLSPLVLLMTKLCKHNVECRKAVRQHILPPDLYVFHSSFVFDEMLIGLTETEHRLWKDGQILWADVYVSWHVSIISSLRTLPANSCSLFAIRTVRPF